MVQSACRTEGWGVGSTILLIDDDETTLNILSRYLHGEGYTVLKAVSGIEALRLAYRERPDVVLLDLMMPGMDGWEVCARLREMAEFPIILVSARTAEADKLRGFRLGVEDYVTKPFSLAELGARIQVVLGRYLPRPGRFGPMYASGDLIVDMEKRQARRGEERIPLTPTEFRLLDYLIQQGGKPVSEDALAKAVWGSYRQSHTAVVRRYIWL